MGRTGKIAIAVAGVLAGLAVVLSLAFLYVTVLYPAYFKTEVVDVQRSPDGTHQVTLQSVGTPYFPFCSAPGRLILSGDESVLFQDQNRDRQRRRKLHGKFMERCLV